MHLERKLSTSPQSPVNRASDQSWLLPPNRRSQRKKNWQSRWRPIARGIILEHPTEASTVAVNATLRPMTDQALLAEMARLLALPSICAHHH
jgi:hypothetical protein